VTVGRTGSHWIQRIPSSFIISLLLLPNLLVAQATSSLSMTEVWSVDWPGTTRISKIVAQDEEGLSFQSGPWIYLLTDGMIPRLIGNFEILDIAGLAVVGGGMELVDRRTGRLVRTDLDGRARSWVRIPVRSPEQIVSGVWTPCGWFMGLVGHANGATSTNQLLIFDSVQNAEVRIELPFPPMQMIATGRFVVISESAAPFRAGFLACDADHLVPIDSSEIQAGLDLETWRPLPTLFVSGRLLQTWVDGRSDRRRFALYGMDGRALRWTDLDAPLTLVAATSSDLVIGLRTIAGLELVGYELLVDQHRLLPSP
jgi:hypothetical protein